jgi:hypothetical protein
VLLPAVDDCIDVRASVLRIVQEVFYGMFPRLKTKGLWIGLASQQHAPLEMRTIFTRDELFYSADVTRILASCREHGTTVTALLSACLLLATGECAARDEDYTAEHINILFLSAVDLRPYINPFVSSIMLGPCSSTSVPSQLIGLARTPAQR